MDTATTIAYIVVINFAGFSYLRVVVMPSFKWKHCLFRVKQIRPEEFDRAIVTIIIVITFEWTFDRIIEMFNHILSYTIIDHSSSYTINKLPLIITIA